MDSKSNNDYDKFKEETNRDSRGLSGLINIGNTCYMNATLQCLFATDMLNYYIKSAKFKDHLIYGIITNEFKRKKSILKLNPHITQAQLLEHICSKKKYLKEKFKSSLTYSLYQLFTLMWSVNCSVKPSQIKNIISHNYPKFRGFNQHDSHELLYCIFDLIHEETKTHSNITKIKVKSDVSKYYQQKKDFIKRIKEIDEETEDKEGMISAFNKFVVDNYNKDIVVKSVEFWKSYLKDNHSVITSLFTGLFSSKVTCNSCHNSNINFEPFNILELPLVDKNNNVFLSLDDCLKNYSVGENVSYKCESCKTDGHATKVMNIFQVPKKLIIQLKRFSNQNPLRMHFGNDKIRNKINFPITNLRLTNIMSDINPNNYSYNLYAIVNHMGGLGGGHYIAHSKNHLDDKWYCFNDDTVSYVSDLNDLVNESVYVLFYERE
jgi:ubiquitin C-terminal hydrolase